MNARLDARTKRMVPVCWRCQCAGVHRTDDQCVWALRVRLETWRERHPRVAPSRPRR